MCIRDSHLQGGVPLREVLAIDDPALTLMAFTDAAAGLAIGTRNGIVKRLKPEYLANRDSWEVISLAEGDGVIGAVQLTTGDDELVFVTSDAHLLHFSASLVRPQGRSGGGVAGIKLGVDATAVFFGAVRDQDVAEVVTVSGSSSALPGTESGAAKVTPLAVYPAKGRATGGVRCHRLLKGEDALFLAWVGEGPAMACASSGTPVDLPKPVDKRDGSGTPSAQTILAVSSTASALTAAPIMAD